MMRYMLAQKMETDTGVDAKTGRLRGQQGCCVNVLPVHAPAGSVLRPANGDLPYRCFRYAPQIRENLIYTYDYDPEANWTTFDPENSDPAPVTGDRRIEVECYLRIAVERNFVPDGASLGSLFQIDAPAGQDPVPDWMESELKRTEESVKKCAGDGDIILLLLTDTHYATGCNWPDTIRSLRMMAQRLSPLALIHLGDLTDGLLRQKFTKAIVEELMEDIRSVCGSAHVCLGNHDLNYFRGNPEVMSKPEGARLYRGDGTLWYTEDLPDAKLRMFFLDSFDPKEKERYGFDREQTLWMRRQLRRTPRGWRVLVFSHVPPLAKFHVWSRTIRGEEDVMEMLERFHKRRRGAVMGWIHGHSHVDQIVDEKPFPIISIGCSKLEDFREHKPGGSLTPERRRNTSSQELWDVLVLHPADGSMDLIRFGAGEDRHIGP